MEPHSKYLVTGHRGLVGRAVVSELFRRNVIPADIIRVNRDLCDLRVEADVDRQFRESRPDYVIHCAARVGGIIAHTKYPADFFIDNMRMEMNVIEAARRWGVKKLLLLGSACAYPKFASTPVYEAALLTGPLEPSNEMYALAKICGLKLCDAYRAQHGCNFISAMPTNLYGRGDTYHPEDSHVIPGMIQKFHKAKQAGAGSVTLWGTGTPKREFLFADDLARACLVLLEKYDSPGTVNVSTGIPVCLGTLAGLIAEVVGFTGRIEWDESKPDGTPDRTLDSHKMFSMGWAPLMTLPEGLQVAYEEYRVLHAQ